MARTMLAGSLQGVVAQTLLPRAGGSGRVGAFEVLVGTNAVRNLIRENQVPQIYSMIQTGSRYGMVTMQDYVKSLLDQGAIDAETAREAVMELTEESDDRDGYHASVALGGGKISAVAGKSEGRSEGGGYSF